MTHLKIDRVCILFMYWNNGGQFDWIGRHLIRKKSIFHRFDFVRNYTEYRASAVSMKFIDTSKWIEYNNTFLIWAYYGLLCYYYTLRIVNVCDVVCILWTLPQRLVYYLHDILCDHVVAWRYSTVNPYV